MKKTMAIIVSVTTLLLTVIFTLQNAEDAQLSVLFWKVEASLALILFITLTIGVVSAVVALLPVVMSLRTSKVELKKINEKFEAKIKSDKQAGIEQSKE